MDILEQIAVCFLWELRARYGARYGWLEFNLLKLQAPGYAVQCLDLRVPLFADGSGGRELFLLKFTAGGVLFDVGNWEYLPDFSSYMEVGMLRRLFEGEYADPRLVELVFEFVGAFLRRYFAGVGG